MIHRVLTASTVLGTALLSMLLAAACGGNSFSNGEDPVAGTGGRSSGGAGNLAGKASGGKPSGGSSQGGMVSVAGTSSSGGSIGSDACSAPPDAGNCEAYIERWYHDPATGLCRGFVYGGCGGNENNYGSLEECQKACRGGSPNYDACSQPTDCMITGGGCCGICDGENVRARDLLAYNKKFAGLITNCDAAGAAAPDIACAACPPLVGDTGTMKYFVPNCVRGECVVEDIRTSVVSECEVDSDCSVRNGNGCCESCGPEQLIAVSKIGDFTRLVCGNLLPPCAACDPQTNAMARCSATKHCEIVRRVGAK